MTDPAPREVLARLRSGALPADAALASFARGIADGRVSDSQAGAFAMGVCLRGLSSEGRTALTLAMRDTGTVMDWDLSGPVVDKHSTGGVGDCTSFLLAPALAACGVFVPMIAGRGLGHTGGTLDKLESIPGLSTDISIADLRQITREVGCVIAGAGAGIAPADRRLYAVRDVTGTVDSIDLITASILSKKLAAGLEALVLDVKAGSGAFLPEVAQARALAQSLVTVARGAGCLASALITDMDRPLARSAGNAVELAEVMAVLTGTARNERLWEASCALGGEALLLSGVAPDAGAGAERVAAALQSGAAAECFGRMLAAQGGPRDFVDRWHDYLPAAPVTRDVPAPRAGTVARIDMRALGMAVVELGGGRQRESDRIDPRVGFSDLAAPGDAVGPATPLGRVHAAGETDAARASAALQAACRIGDAPPESALILERIT